METTAPSQWKKNVSEVLEVPSGNKCRAHKKPLQAFLKAGMIPNSLMPIVQSWMKKAQGKGGPIEVDINVEDTQQVIDMLQLLDNVVIECLDEPKVLPVPDDEADRDTKLLYVDEVSFEDKNFIYAWALGGVEDLKSFLDQQSPDVGSVSGSASVDGTAEPAVGA